MTVVAGGYDPSLAPEAYEEPRRRGLHRARRRGPDVSRSAAALERGHGAAAIAGLSIARRRRLPSQPAAPVSALDDGDRAAGPRARACSTGYTFLGRPIDIVETSRGCTYDCSFCSIIEMRGRNFHTFGFERVLADIADARARGARAIFIVDDNITLNVARFEALCRAIVAAGLNDIHYIVQAMTSSIADHGETLAPLMRQAGFRYVFLGIENVLDEDLAFLKARGQERGARGRPDGRQRARCARSTAPPARHVRRRRHHRRQPGRHARVDRDEPRVRARATSTGRTSSIRRRIPARR